MKAIKAKRNCFQLLRQLLIVGVNTMAAGFVAATPIHCRIALAADPSQAITLTPNGGTGSSELVNLGIPFPPGQLFNAGNVRILDESNKEIPAFAKPLLIWHFKDGSIRAVKVQFFADMTAGVRKFSFDYSILRTKSISEQPYDNGTRPAREGFPVPRVLATLTPQWMTASLIVGPQKPKTAQTAFDTYYESQWATWARDLSYTAESSMWLFDRVTSILNQYVRTGTPGYLSEAFNSYRFYMSKIVTSGLPEYPDCAGGWRFGDTHECDVKYVYTKPILLMLALTGDDTQHTGKIDLMAQLWESGGWNEPIQPYSSPSIVFTERLIGLGLSAIVAAYQITGNSHYLTVLQNYTNYLYNHQQNNPDGFGFDGCWRHSWALHEGNVYPGNVADDRGCSPWMSAMIIGALWDAYQVTNDVRIPQMVRSFAQYMENFGWIPPSWGDADEWKSGCQGEGGTIAGYWSSSVASIATLVDIQGSEGYYSDCHNPDLMLAVAWTWSLEANPVKKQVLVDRIALLTHWYQSCAAKSEPPRMFNWQHRDSVAAQWFLIPAQGDTVNVGTGCLLLLLGDN